MSRDRPLNGLRVLITRPAQPAKQFAAALEALGAQAVVMPTVRIEPIEQVPGLEAAVRRLDRYHWVIFTSANAVGLFWDWLRSAKVDPAALNALRVAAIGPATAEALREHNLQPAFVPDDYVGEALGEGLPQVAGQRILLPRASGSRPALPEILERRGAQVDEFHLYRAVPADLDLEPLRRGLDVLTFTSPSTVRGFVDQLRAAGLDPLALPGSPITACIGPITAEAANAIGLAPRIVAEEFTVDGLVLALTAYYRREQVA